MHLSQVILYPVYLVPKRVVVASLIEVGLQQLVIKSLQVNDVLQFFGFVQERLLDEDRQVDSVVGTVQVLVDDLVVLLLSAEHDAVELHVFAIVFGILKLIRLCMFLQAHFAQLEEHTVHELHPSLKLRECLVEQIAVFLLKHTHSHD